MKDIEKAIQTMISLSKAIGLSAKEFNMKNDNIFKKGDKVYHFVFGWGSVTSDSEKGVCDVIFEDKGNITILCKEIHLSFCKYDLINGGLSHERPFELEVGKSYKAWHGSALIINRIGRYGNYGFQSGQWIENNPCRHAEQWREATDEEVKQALEKEVIRRYGENWEDVKIVKSIGMVPYGDNYGEFDVEIKEYSSSGWVVWNKNGCLFKEGVWAEKLEEPESSEFETGESVLIRDCPSENWRFNLFSHRDKSKTLSYAVIGRYYRYCIPYEGNEHLLNTSKFPES